MAYPNFTWQSVNCVIGPSVPLVPMAPSVVGDGVDEVAYSSSGTLIGSSTGSFQAIGGLTSESDSVEGSNYYSLQINSQTFPTTTTYTANEPTTGWEQFVFINYPADGSGYIYIQYWLISYQSRYGRCPNTGPPSGTNWMTYEGSCYANSMSISVPLEPASNLGNLILEGDANLNSNDENLFCISGGACYAVSPTDQVLDLYQHWVYSEFNIFGFGDGSQANFNAGTSITIENTLEDQSGNGIAPSCVETGYTGETNNLNLSSCSSNGSSGELIFNEISPQASVSPPSIDQGQSLSYAGSGFTPNGAVQVVVNSGSGIAYIVGTPTATSTGTISGNFIVGTNIQPGTRQITFTDEITSLAVVVDVTVIQQTVVTTTTTSTTSTFTSSTSTFLTTTTTTSTSTSTSTVGQSCTATSTTQTTSIIIQATGSSSTTTTATTTGTSTFLTTTSSTATSTTVMTTTTTASVCTQTSTSTSVSTTFTTFTRPPTSITVTPSPASIAVGSSAMLSGSISPNPGVVTVTFSFSRDSGSTWAMLLSLMTNSSGSYSIAWTPPAPGNYLLEASWVGNNEFAPSQSASAALTVTGSVLPTPTVLLSSPATASPGQPLTLSITVFNPTSSTLNANATIEITGPNNYLLFDVIQVKVGANSHATSYYDWGVPAQTGAYTIMLSLLSPIPSGVDVGTIQVT